MGFVISPRLSCEIGNDLITLEGNVSLDLELNPEKIPADRALFPSVLRVFKTAEGVSLFGKLAENSLKLVNELGLVHSREAANRFADGVAVLTVFPRLPGLWFEVKKSVAAVRESKESQTPAEARRKWDKGVHHVCEAVSATSKAAAVTLSLSAQNVAILDPIKPFVGVFSFIGNASSLKMNVEDLNAVNKVLAEVKNVSSDFQTVLYQTKKGKLLALVKNVCSVAAAFFGVILIATGVGIVSGTALLVLSLGSVTFSLWGKIHEEGMRWKPIDFFGGKHVKHCSL